MDKTAVVERLFKLKRHNRIFRETRGLDTRRVHYNSCFIMKKKYLFIYLQINSLLNFVCMKSKLKSGPYETDMRRRR